MLAVATSPEVPPVAVGSGDAALSKGKRRVVRWTRGRWRVYGAGREAGVS